MRRSDDKIFKMDEFMRSSNIVYRQQQISGELKASWGSEEMSMTMYPLSQASNNKKSCQASKFWNLLG